MPFQPLSSPSKYGMHTLTEPTTGPFLLSLDRAKVCFPIFLSFIVHVLANVSSVWPVRMSSQSFVLVVENEIAVIGGSFNDARGIDKLVAFFASEPTKKASVRVKNEYRSRKTYPG